MIRALVVALWLAWCMTGPVIVGPMIAAPAVPAPLPTVFYPAGASS
jgi:hypothetical protein